MFNVLIADAHPIARSGLHIVVERLVARAGDECVVAYSEDAITALRKAKRLQPDLILLSAQLPQSGGLEVVLALRQYTPRTKLVIVTDAAAQPDPYLDAGADGVLSKSLTELEIEEALRRLLRSDKPAPRAA
jgi:DNA-binding NarL/FixJ family response regulator